MPFSYTDIANGLRWKRGEILNSALHSKNMSSSQGASSLFCNALFCVLEREFRRNPNKKRAILIWEMFIDGNFPTKDWSHDKVFVPTKAIWPSALEMNVEGSGGVSQSAFADIRNGMDTVLGVYKQGSMLTNKQRKKTSHVRKFGIIGGKANRQMFQSVVDNVKKTIPQIGAAGVSPKISGVVAKSIYNNLAAIKTAVEKAGFNVNGTGLSKITA